MDTGAPTETLGELLERWEQASPEARQTIEQENTRLGDLATLLRTYRAFERAKMMQASSFGLTPASVVRELLADTVEVSFGQGMSATLTADEFVAVLDALVLALPSWGDELRAVNTVEARYKLLDALGIDERSPVDEYADAVKLLDDEEHREVSGPGKFEGCHDARIARALYELTLDSGQDESCGSADGPIGWVGRVGRFLVREDSQGFFTYSVFEDDLMAHEAYAELEQEEAELGGDDE